MFPAVTLLAFALTAARAQQIGTNTAEKHPSLAWQKCTKAGGCTNVAGSVVLDSNWRWLHTTSGYTNCYDGNSWNTTLCPDGATCAKNCALDGADYSGTYGVTTSGNALSMKFVTGKNVGSRVYLMDSADSKYQQFNMLNQEFTMDVDVSNLPCGLNGAVYFSEMPADGGVGGSNAAGAKYGTGYCDSQCPHDIKFIKGEANVDGWSGSPNDTNAGSGKYGACCAEMDIWEANSISAAVTPHPCGQPGLVKCSGTTCGDGDNRYGGICDKDGCDFNSYRQGDKSFYGPGKTVDTTKKFTLVTQFITNNNSSSGTLTEIRRLYVQNGKVIANSKSTQPAGYDSITTAYCNAQKTLFGDTNSFSKLGGLTEMGNSFKRGMTLVLSIWDDHAVNMLWLDSTFPVAGNPATPGVGRGTCATTSGKPTDVEANSPNASVTYSNIRLGEIGSTYTGTGTGGGTSSSSSTGGGSTGTTPTSTSSAPSATQTKYGQCGGTGYSGPTACASGATCQTLNPYYSQCL